MNEKLLRYLLEQQLLTAEQADELRHAQEETNKSIRELILERAILPEEQVIEALSSLTRTPVVHLYEMTIPMDVRQAVRPDILRTYTMMPFQFDPEDSGTLYVAMNEPMNMKGRDMVAIASKCRIKPFLATTSDILVTIDRCYGSEEMQEAAELYTQTNERESASLEDQVFQEDVNASPVVVLVNSLVEQAVRQRASDIHVESGPDKVRVRCRVDGVLYTTATYDLQLLPAIIARIKILSNLDISEKRRPQDVRFSILVVRLDYAVRVSTLPTVYGEKCVMRLTQKKALRRSKRALGLTGSELEKFDEILRHPNGIVLVTGPTGSGKSTIIQSLLNRDLNLSFSISATSRAPRGTEKNGIEYYFITPDEFRERIANDEFLEYEEVYAGKFYGTLKSEVERILDSGKNVIFDVDVVGGLNIKKYYGNQALALFIQPPSIQALEQRLKNRATDTPEVIAHRIAKAEYELSFAPKFDKIIVNDILEKAQEEAYRSIRQFLYK